MDDQVDNYNLRPYQETLIKQCMNGNSIVLLPTGTGKTLISFSVMMEYFPGLMGQYPEVAKRSVFLAPTKVLVEQQQEEFGKYYPHIKSIYLHGEHGVDLFTQDQWNNYLQNYQVLFFTPQVFSDLLTKKYVEFKNINVVVFDECHHACKKKGMSKHPYRIIMEIYKHQRAVTKVVCLSASLFHSIKPLKIEEGIREMEMIYQSKIFTADSSSFSKDAQTFVVECHSADFAQRVEQNLNSFHSILENTYEQLKKNQFSEFEQLQETLGKIEKIIREMGPYFAIEGLKLIADKLDQSASTSRSSIKSKKLILDLKQKLSDIFPQSNGPEEGTGSLIHPKIDILFKILDAFPAGTPCIVFVKERVVANVLYRYIKYCSEHFPKWSKFKPGFFIGQTNSTDKILRFDANYKDMKPAFESKDLNLVIATSVLEEGIDVPSCKVVIRFDFPNNFRAYLQSRGRARHRESAYFLMADFEPAKSRQLLTEYRFIESKLKKYQTNLEAEYPKDNADFGQDRYFTEAGAILLENNAKQIVSQYLQKNGALPKNHFFLKEFENDDSGRLYSYAFWYPPGCPIFGLETGKQALNKDTAEISCAFNVCKRLIEEGEIDSHLEIRRNAPEKCINELNLKVKSFTEKVEFNKETAELEQVNSKYSEMIKKPISQSSKSLYTLFCVDFGNDSGILGAKDGKSLKFGFLTPCNFPFEEHVFPLCLNQTNFNVKISRVTQKRMSPQMEEFKSFLFFTKHILKTVLVEGNSSDGSLMGNLIDENDKPDDLSFQTNFLLVPMKDDNEVDFEMIEKLLAWRQRIVEKNRNLQSIVPEIHDNTEGLKEMVLTYAHARTIKFNTFGSGKQVECNDVMGNKKTYKQHFMERYNLQVDDNLFHMEELGKTLNRKKIHITKKHPRVYSQGEIGHQHYSLKSAVVYPMSLAQIMMFNTWTFINYRLEQYMKSLDLLKIIHNDMNIESDQTIFVKSIEEYSIPSDETYRSINVELIEKPNRDSQLEIQDRQILQIKDRSREIGTINRAKLFEIGKCLHNFGMATCFIENLIVPLWNPPSKYSLKHSYFQLPDPGSIVRAMTLEKGGDCFDNEQLEFVGDAFLKMTTCLYLYFKYEKFSEGDLTQLKSILVSNEHLYILAKEKGLFKYIFANILDVGKEGNWKATFHNENIPTKQELKYKDIADCVEALIGAFLIHGSFDALLYFFEWIGLKAFDPSGTIASDPMHEYQTNIDRMREEAKARPDLNWCVKYFNDWNFDEMIQNEYLKNKFNEVEDMIGYKFKNKFYLIQAFTNSSYLGTLNESTFNLNLWGSNERLEFIGDGILDFLIALKIFEANEQFRPKELTTLKVALVNNSFFASIVVKFGLHKYLRHSSSKIDDGIVDYVEYFQAIMQEQQSNILGVAHSIIPIVDAPKFLSDIFEALVGAIYIDNGFDLDELWKIVFHLIRPEFEFFIQNIPMNPVSMVQEKYPGKFKFSKAEKDAEFPEFATKVVLFVYEDTEKTVILKEFVGHGTRKQLARVSAALKCLRDEMTLSKQ